MSMSEELHHELREVDPDDKKTVSKVVSLHLELLDWGPIAGLGRLFLERFCYSVLVRDGLIKLVLYEVNGRPAGFIAYTSYSNTFMRTAIRKHWLFVLFLLKLSVLRDPRILFRLNKSGWLTLSRWSESSPEKDPCAEILAFAVRSEYRNIAFIHNTKLRIPYELVSHAVSYFRGLGLTKMYAVVDEFNKPVQLFFHSLGGKLGRISRKKETMFRINFDLRGMPL